VSEQRRAELARDFPKATVLDDYHQLLELPEVDTVLVMTPIALNAPAARTALLAGKHVIMEKPVARSVAEGQDLVATARRMGRQLAVTEQMAYRQLEQIVSDVLDSGEIGDLVMWNRVHHLEVDSAPGPLRFETTPWRKQPDFPLGTLFDGGVHLIASLTRMFGAPQTITATGRQLRPEYGEFDHVAVMFQYEHEITGLLSHSTYLPAARQYFHIYGSAGVITLEPGQLNIEAANRPQRVIELPHENPYVSMWQALARARQAQQDPFYTPERALQDVAILETIDRAIKTGARLPVITPQPVTG